MDNSFETVSAQWFDPNALRLPAYKVGRINYGYGRSYVRLLDGELEKPFRLYTSLTTAINQCAPMAPQLLEWYCKLGMQEAQHRLTLSQHYGTLMHLLIGQYLTDRFYDFDRTGMAVQEYLSEHSYYDQETDKWASKLKYDIAAFIAFSQDHNVIPLGIEYVLLSQKGFGTLIDLVCKMEIEEKGFFGEVYKSGIQQGQPKETKRRREVMALINFKSGRHQFYRTSGIQVECEKQLWEENFPDMPLECAFNWSPKEWITEPGWNLKDWSGEIEQDEVDAMLKLAQIRFGDKAVNKKYISIQGTAVAHKPVRELLNIKTAEQYCMEKYTNLMS